MEERRQDLVKRWTRKVDLFSKDYIVIPVNVCCHWYLVMVCFPSNVTNFSNIVKEPEMNSENMANEQDKNEKIKMQMAYKEGGSQSSESMVTNAASDSNSNRSQRQ
ncbi:hypothetical protein TNCT_552441 [Trichonephila clavata]|uniref:Ubiquitin-like protease family profile domain-containing protein n=1 Tax=Trichonephila clavata TaxID=2740835 RepID=A0A8X6GKG0_TRICU|nr:hypothetical protein TNCT_552441 [Trichonephila clavata]